MPPGDADALLRRVTAAVALEPLAGCDLDQEAVTEVLAVPASVLRLVEVVRGEDTSGATVEAGAAPAERLGKAPARLLERPGSP